ncbi:MAG TPA: glucose-6-phosphate isomerase family protein [Bryobacteraceae bacterium]|nr:glucose-6-phosphate isomerase family protein [Bryobacteraceae bacterium]
MAIHIDYVSGRFEGEAVRSSVKTLGAMRAAYRDTAAAQAAEAATVVYRVEYWQPVEPGVPGGLFVGTTVLAPGRIGDEYFMTSGHFHAVRDRAEMYLTLSGEGGLILMDEDRKTRWEPMRPGSVHYIPGFVAHRVANTGDGPLSFLACWGSDAGHDYAAIERSGFAARLRAVNGRPELVAE